ncbi:phosphoribosyltransferase-like protein, partial [Mesorhizobium japonicum]|uniref:phosphoribosyltransferase-like protein n=1 Tax=Mesorhizobium japonicum TaxID=2066070 RepID=UPI003B5BE115
DKFTFYNRALTDALLVASYNSIGDGMPKGPLAPTGPNLIASLSSAILTPVKGENPNPTDSGYLLCRKARQLLHLNDSFILDTEAALAHAYDGKTVVFIDDFVGSGDQFLYTWKTIDKSGRSFEKASEKSKFTALYITLITTDFGLQKINDYAPTVAVCATHVVESKSALQGVLKSAPNMRSPIL